MLEHELGAGLELVPTAAWVGGLQEAPLVGDVEEHMATGVLGKEAVPGDNTDEGSHCSAVAAAH
jgi:hypothetical protein